MSLLPPLRRGNICMNKICKILLQHFEYLSFHAEALQLNYLVGWAAIYLLGKQKEQKVQNFMNCIGNLNALRKGERRKEGSR